MKNKYDTLENEYKNTAKELALITGWTPQQAEKVLALVAGFSKKKAETVAKEQRKNQKNSRIIATKKLLKNYRNLKISLKCGMEHNLKLLEDYEYQRLMEKEESVRNQKLTSMALLTASNQVLWARLNSALDCFKEMCKNETSPSAQRGYKLIYARYLCDTPISISAIEERFAIEHSTFYKNLNRAVATLSVILFGSESAEDFCLGDDL